MTGSGSTFILNTVSLGGSARLKLVPASTSSTRSSERLAQLQLNLAAGAHLEMRSSAMSSGKTRGMRLARRQTMQISSSATTNGSSAPAEAIFLNADFTFVQI